MTTSTPDTTPDTSAIARIVADSGVVVCCGSGGVGKTTIAAVLALEGARRGRHTCVVTIDPAKRLADALGLESPFRHAPGDRPGALEPATAAPSRAAASRR